MDDHVDGMVLSIRARLNLNCVSTPHQPSGQTKARLAARGQREEAVHDSIYQASPFFCPYLVFHNSNSLESFEGSLADGVPSYIGFEITSTGCCAPQMQLVLWRVMSVQRLRETI